jgi:hypothetical protein
MESSKKVERKFLTPQILVYNGVSLIEVSLGSISQQFRYASSNGTC